MIPIFNRKLLIMRALCAILRGMEECRMEERLDCGRHIKRIYDEMCKNVNNVTRSQGMTIAQIAFE